MGLMGEEATEWDQLRDCLRVAGLCWDVGGDSIVWDGPLKDGNLIVKDIYRSISASTNQGQISRIFFPFQCRNIPIKIVLFGWLIWRGKVLNGENLVKHGHHGPFRCVICCSELESISHLFFRCPAVVALWQLFSSHFLDPSWFPEDFISSASHWDKLRGKFRSLPFFLIWEVWLARNRCLFDDVPFQNHRIFLAIMKWIDDRPSPVLSKWDGSICIRPHEVAIPAIYFDGACVEGVMGCGAWKAVSEGENPYLLERGHRV